MPVLQMARVCRWHAASVPCPPLPPALAQHATHKRADMSRQPHVCACARLSVAAVSCGASLYTSSVRETSLHWRDDFVQGNDPQPFPPDPYPDLSVQPVRHKLRYTYPKNFGAPCATFSRLGCAEDAGTWPWIFGAAWTKCPTFLRVEMHASAGRNEWDSCVSKQHLKLLCFENHVRSMCARCPRDIEPTPYSSIHGAPPISVTYTT